MLVLGTIGGWAFLRPWLYPTVSRSVVLNTDYAEGCLAPGDSFRPVWECYEIPTDAPVNTEVLIRHVAGETHRSLTFRDRGKIKFRFTPSLPGRWEFGSGGAIEIQENRPDYAKGFVAAAGSNWIRTATGEAFVPQYIMYGRADLDQGVEEFVVGHGFTGFHINHLRDFLDNPEYFEAVVLKTYRRGGVTHFWIWGDEMRNQTPETYGVDADGLYRAIAARLGPIPGWTVGYGFDLHEWASAREIEGFRSTLNSLTGYRHMVGARGHNSTYEPISSNLDYASWEWHRPTVKDYRDHLLHSGGKPAFSEDRFRIRHPTKYPEKDYDFELTRRGLWHSAIAGGVANIWGHKPASAQFSVPYPNKSAIRTYRATIDRYFEKDMVFRGDILENGFCLEGQSNILCYLKDTDTADIRYGPEVPIMGQVVAIDTLKPFQPSITPVQDGRISMKQLSDWALVLQKAHSQDTVSDLQP